MKNSEIKIIIEMEYPIKSPINGPLNASISLIMF